MYEPAPIGSWQDAWLRSLESGEHKQVEGVLTKKTAKGYAHCCLGVACEVALQNGFKLKVNIPDLDPEYVDDDADVSYDGSDSVLPESMMDLFGFRTNDSGDTDGQIDVDFVKKLRDVRLIDDKEAAKLQKEFDKLRKGEDSLAGMNDSAKAKFKDIAKFIRRFPGAVFTKAA